MFNLGKSSPPPPNLDERLSRDYSTEATRESYREIERLAMWARSRGPLFYLIGGWAAWHYHRGVGSRDIDIVFPNQPILEAFLADYYRQNGYERVGDLVSHSYRKTLKVGSQLIHIEIDACQIDQAPPFKENEHLELPYTLLPQHSVGWRIGREVVLVPTPELLVLQKVKAYRDRSWELDHRLLSPTEAEFLRGKVLKDAYDIRGVGAQVTDWSRVGVIAEAHACRVLVKETLEKLGFRRVLEGSR